MKAVAVFPKSRQVKLVDHPEPQVVGPYDVKLRILEVGICGTDREIASFQYGTPPAGSEYLVLGHEALGEVVQVGEQVSRVHVGALVVPMVRRPCPHESCLACREGRQDFCFTGEFTEHTYDLAGSVLFRIGNGLVLYVIYATGHPFDSPVFVEPTPFKTVFGNS